MGLETVLLTDPVNGELIELTGEVRGCFMHDVVERPLGVDAKGRPIAKEPAP